MNPDGYQIRRVQPAARRMDEPEVVGVDPFPVRRWREPLPTAGLPFEINDKPGPEKKKGIEAFYPPLLAFSTLLTGVFFWLYVTKPVVMPEVMIKPGQASGEMVLVKQELPKEEAPNLVPWPDEDRLPGEEITEVDLDRIPVPVEAGLLEETNLRMQQVVMADLGGTQMERIEFDLPVFYESRTLSWTPERIEEARLLASDLNQHLLNVRMVRENGERLMEQWRGLVSDSMPIPVLRADSPSLPANQGTQLRGGRNMAIEFSDDSE